jgi:XTP/dITP diphosphohydrolase
MKRIYFITGNKGKLIEAQNKFSKIDVEIIQKDLGYPEIQADSLEDVARDGIEYIKERFDQPFIIEDAGLFIDALNGFPGVYSSYVFHTIGCEGILRLLDKIKNTDRKAIFRSVFAYYEPDKEPMFFIGESYGHISKNMSGKHGFGYDPIFIPDNEEKTFAEMDVEEKNRFSHRGKSLEKLIDFFINR